MLELTFKIIPRGKGRPRFFARGKFVQVYTDAATKKHENELAKQAKAQLPSDYEKLSGPLAVDLKFYMPRPKSLPKKDWEGYHWKKPDLDNMEKILWDSLNDIVWNDDSQIAYISASKRYSDEPGIKMTVVPL